MLKSVWICWVITGRIGLGLINRGGSIKSLRKTIHQKRLVLGSLKYLCQSKKASGFLACIEMSQP